LENGPEHRSNPHTSREQLASGQLPPTLNLRGHHSKVRDASAHAGRNIPRRANTIQILGNYAYINLNDPTPLYVWPDAGYSAQGNMPMRLWVQPRQLAKLGITVTDIVNAVQAQNTVNPAARWR